VIIDHFLNLIGIGFGLQSSLLNQGMALLVAKGNLFKLVLKTSFSLLMAELSRLLDLTDLVRDFSGSFNLLIDYLGSELVGSLKLGLDLFTLSLHH